MTANQENQLKELYFSIRAYINAQDFEDSELVVKDIESAMSKISKWINQC